MSEKPASIRLTSDTPSSQLEFKKLDYLGSGAYECQLLVNANGFMCDREFSFDNDEYFVAKLREVLATQTGEADLMALESDSYIRIQPYHGTTLLVSGLIVEEQPLSQSLEFAFTADEKSVTKFVTALEKIVRANT